MAKADLHYITDSMFVTFIPNTDAGEQAWASMLEQNEGSPKVFRHQFASVRQQLKSAGFVVRKSPRVTLSTDALLAELEG